MSRFDSNLTYLIVLTVMISPSLLSSNTAYGASVADIAEMASPSVVIIIAYDITGAETGQGSGFFIDDSGRIITNAHVMKDAYSAEVFSESNYYADIAVLKRDEELDIAVIQVEANYERPLELDFEYAMRPGERVIAIGNPLGLEKTISDGLISAVRQYGEELEIIQTTVPISPGSSGGPLLNMAGEVVGVTSATITEGQNINFAISVRSIIPFLSMPDKGEHLHPPKSKVWFRWFIKWVWTIVIGLIAFAFGGGWWVIFIVILVITAVYHLIRGVIHGVSALVRWSIKVLKRKRSGPPGRIQSTDSEESEITNDLIAEDRAPLVRYETIEDKIAQLRQLIHYHQHKYYVDKSPEISDLEYDQLKTELRSIEQTHPERVTPDSPTRPNGTQPSSNEADFSFCCMRCGSQLRTDSSVKGHVAKCPKCGTEYTIPY